MVSRTRLLLAHYCATRGGAVLRVDLVVITLEELKSIMPHAGNRAETFLEPLNAAMDEFEITGPVRQAAFLAQIAHESGSLRYVSELADGAAYNFRQDLGNDQPGDGPKYKGHGLIQITGKNNHFEMADYFGIPRDQIVEWLQTPEGACRSAGRFWQSHGLNELADKGDFKLITKRINGGFNGYQDRLAYFERAQQVLA